MDELSRFESYLLKRKRGIGTSKWIQQHLYRLGVMLRTIQWDEESFENFILSLRKEGRSGSSLNKYLITAKYYCEFKEVVFNSRVFERFPEERKPPLTLSDQEIEAFLSIPPNPEKEDRGGHAKFSMFWKCVAFSGCRPGEMAKMTIDSVDFANNSFIFWKTKTKVGRLVNIYGPIRNELKDYISGLKTQLLFPPTRFPNQVMSEKAWEKDFKDRIKRLGIIKRVTPYCLRHTLATDLLNNGASFPVVSKLLGHSNPKTTMIYHHSNLVAQEKAMKNHTLYEKHMSNLEHIMQCIQFIQEKHLEMKNGVNYLKVLDAFRCLHEAVDSS